MTKKSFFLLVLVIILFSCNSRDQRVEYGTYSCDAEKTEEIKDKEFFKGDGALFLQPNTQTEEESRSGVHAIKLNKNNPYGFTFKDMNAKPGDYYKVSVWRKSEAKKGLLVIADKQGKKLYKQEKHPVAKDDKGWELLEVEVFIPPHYKGEELKIYVWNPHEPAAYFDDITIEKKPKKEYPSYEDPLQIVMEKDQYSFLEKSRNRAYEKGHIGKEEKGEVPAILSYFNNKSAIDIRLKGDWLDHINGKKWSFRIKSKDDFFWRRMKEFSVQNPATRSFLNEWVLHQILLQEGVLTTRYDFIPIELNRVSLGIYAYEEHFEKQLVESQNRREGVQLRITEDSFWEWIEMIQNEDTLRHILPMAEAATIEPFNTKSILNNPIFRTQFSTAQNIIWRFKNAKGNLSEVLDFDAFAKYFAIADLTRAKHGFGTLNLRFYFNPISQKIEPIAYDGYGGELKETEGRAIVGYTSKCDSVTNDPKDYPSYALFNDSAFVSKYVNYLEKYSNELFIDSLMLQMKKEIEKREKLLQKEYQYYSYDYQFLTETATQIRHELPLYKKQLEECWPVFTYQRNSEKALDYESCKGREATEAIALKAYLREEKESSYVLTIQNFHCEQLKILGYGKKGGVEKHIKKEVLLKAYRSDQEIPTMEIEMSKDYNRIYYSAVDSKQELAFKFLPWQLPSNKITVREKLIEENDGNMHAHKNGNELLYKGKIESKTPIIIPKGYNVSFEKGTELDLLQGAFFISFSPVRMLGTEEKNIVIKSSDNSSMGFSVFESTIQSDLKYVTFDGLKNLNYEGWLLMGAVNFYKTKVNFENCKFINNESEDGLNTISSEFEMKNCLFENTFGDAFDADFCTGKVMNTTLVNTGNDGLDFSGSNIQVTNCKMDSVGDKAISVGEKSYVNIENLEVDKSVFGLVAKDLSQAYFSSITLLNCEHEIAVYQKKPEYGPATIKGSGLIKSNKEEQFLVDLNSILQIGEKTIKGNTKIDVDALYN